MLILPAIDLYEGKAVRLLKGDYAQMTVYSGRPREVAADFRACGAQWIHMVDLEGARDGSTPNFGVVADIAQTSGEVDIQIGDVELTSDVGSAQSVTLSASDDPMLFLSGYLSPGKKATVLTSRTDLKDGFYTAEITTESLQPISLLFARN